MMIAISSVHRPFTVGSPRRSPLLSTESSWISAAACTISTTVAHSTASRPRWPRSRAVSSSSVGRNFFPRVASTWPPTSFRIGIGVRKSSRRWVCTRSSSRRTGFWTADISMLGFIRGGKAGPLLLCAPQNTGVRRKVSSLWGRGGPSLAKAHREVFARVARRVVEHLLEERFQGLPDQRTRGNGQLAHHVASVHHEVGDAERARFREQLLDPRPHLLQVDRKALPEAVAQHVGDPEIEEVGHRLRAHPAQPAPEGAVAPARAEVEHVLPHQVNDPLAALQLHAQSLEHPFGDLGPHELAVVERGLAQALDE